MRRRMPGLRRQFGWSEQLTDHLLHRYGSLIEELLELIEEDPSLSRPLEHAPAYLRAEIAYACISEGALHLEDLLMRRTRLVYEAPDQGRSALPEIAEIAEQWLGWGQNRLEDEIESYTAWVRGVCAAAEEDDDEAALTAFHAERDSALPVGRVDEAAGRATSTATRSTP